MKTVLCTCLFAATVAAQTPSIYNLSARANTGVGGDAMFAGFNIGPGGNKTILIRAAGPRLKELGVQGALLDPKIELFSVASGTKIGENDNWGTSIGGATAATAEIFSSVGAFEFSTDSRDGALVASLSPGAYTTIVSGIGEATGVTVLEVYEYGASSSRLTNISARARVGTGEDILFAGFVVSPGSGTRRLLIRAAGPSLGELDVEGFLEDPQMVVLDVNETAVATNDNWGTPVGANATVPAGLAAAFGPAGAFAFEEGSRDSALIADFAAGNYTIQVRGINNTTGVAVVEVYDITGTPEASDFSSVYGTYRRVPVENGYHVGTIALKEGSGTSSMLEWRNEAGITWNLIPDLDDSVLRTDSTNPYQTSGAPDFHLEMYDDEVIGFTFLNEYYTRDGAPPRLVQRIGGLHGYLSATMERPPPAYAYGYSFYTSIWPLIERQLSDFQVGLAGSWIIPDNEDFTQPLLPLGAGTIRESSPERASTNWRDVFQTIEGSSGYWGNLRFPGSTPKLRINGTPDGYRQEISSPGWGWGNTLALARENMGLAQLSNRLLVPPDGITYGGEPNGEIAGIAWMSLPLTPAKPGGLAPIGEQSWTLFLNTANFKGPVVFWIPDVWTRLSRSYLVIQGRGLDARPSLMGGTAMEFNSVPFFEGTANDGKTYTRIPRMRFPVDGEGRTYIVQDLTAYSVEALADGVRAWLAGGTTVDGRFRTSGSFKPALYANALSFTQGADDMSELPVSGIETTLQPTIFDTSAGSTAFGLRWLGTGTAGAFPEYFEKSSGSVRAISETELPIESGLAQINFTRAFDGPSYTSPASLSDSWTNPAPSAGPYTTTLADGTVLTYSWYRFADQPMLQALGWSAVEKEALQAVVEKIHTAWAETAEFMPPPTRGTLVSLDAGVLVTPPAGLEIGYVPIVTRQEAQ